MKLFLELGATIFGIIQGILVMYNKRSNWIAYIFQMIFLILFSISMNLYGDIINNIIYLILGIIGYILWNKSNNKKITKCSKIEKIAYTIIIFVVTFIGYIILKDTNDPLPLLDSFTTVSSIIATYYMIKKKLDTWIIWLINDIFYALEYYILPNQAIYLFILNIVWILMAILSYIKWNKILKEERNI